MADTTPLSKALSQYLIEHNMTQDEVASDCGMPTSTFSSMITRGVTPDVTRMRKLAAGLGWDYKRILILAGYATAEDYELSPLDSWEEEILSVLKPLTVDNKRKILSIVQAALQFQNPESVLDQVTDQVS